MIETIDGSGFAPRWASPPGDTIREALDERGISVEQLADLLDMTTARVETLLEGNSTISIELAAKLESVIGGTVQFWISRDGQYRDDLRRVALYHWVRTLPTAHMVALGWIERPASWQESIARSLEFFNVPNLEEWLHSYGSVVAAARFRLAASGRVNDVAVAAWLRKAEIEANNIDTDRWDRNAFEASLAGIRRLSLIRDPQVFIPRLVATCASSGVSVVVVRAPRGCPASGATRFIGRKPSIVLSARYLSDDQFWYAFFHEAAHVLLHDETATYVDEFEPSREDLASADEKEADAFAADLLLPRDIRGETPDVRPVPRDIVRFARSAEVSPGVVVGQLQHLGVLGFATKLNGFKRRYKWNGSTLDKA